MLASSPVFYKRLPSLPGNPFTSIQQPYPNNNMLKSISYPAPTTKRDVVPQDQIIRNLEQDANNWKTSYINLYNQLNLFNQKLSSGSPLDQKLQGVLQENQKLNALINDKSQLINKLTREAKPTQQPKENGGTVSSDIAAYKKEMERKLGILEQNLDKLNSLLKQKNVEKENKIDDVELEAGRQEDDELESGKPESDLEAKCAFLSSEILRLNQMLNQKNETISKLETQVGVLQKEISNREKGLSQEELTKEQYENRIAMLSGEIERLRTMLEMKKKAYEKENDQDDAEIDQLKIENSALIEENEELKNQIDQLKAQLGIQDEEQ